MQNYNIKDIKSLLESYNNYVYNIKNLNRKLKYRVVESDYLPAILTENIVKFIIETQLNAHVSWDNEHNKLLYGNKKILVKQFSNTNKKNKKEIYSLLKADCDIICFLDVSKHLLCKFTLYIFDEDKKLELSKTISQMFKLGENDMDISSFLNVYDTQQVFSGIL